MLASMLALVLATILSVVVAECPGACSGHGKCGQYDMCTCYNKWTGNDCSERVCQFGLAHVDTPKGDLDSSAGSLGDADVTVIPNNAIYKYGTQEKFPAMYDTDNNVVTESAHYYMECSNKGICDRASGTCACYEGYEGVSCQRASCPTTDGAVCSGHGVCESAAVIAASMSDNIYRLWDENITMGCVCDGGYSGPDCSERECKYGVDPLYEDDHNHPRFANFTYEIYTVNSAAFIVGNYSLLFTDRFGEDWETSAIQIGATCDGVTDALEALPNKVIPSGSVKCYQYDGSDNIATLPIQDRTNYFIGGANAVKPNFVLVFTKNPGEIAQIDINIYLDGDRPTLYSSETTSTLNWHIYANGFTGEDVDFVPDLCEGVLVTLDTAAAGSFVTHAIQGLTVAESKLLKRCLGDSDGDSTNNVEVYNWDYGNAAVSIEYYDKVLMAPSGIIYSNEYANPHLIKLVDATQDVAAFTITADENTIIVTDDNTDVTTIYTEDSSLTPEPLTRICSDIVASCSNKSPPGFYAVVFYDGTNFNIITRAAQDYTTDTQFHVFTTTGYLQRVSPISKAFSYTAQASTKTMVDAYYSNTLLLRNSSSPNDDYHGAIDCETNPAGDNAAADCIEYGDNIMLLSVDDITSGGSGAATQAVNPVYPNIHKVKKIFRSQPDMLSNPFSETERNKLVLDYGVNAGYTDIIAASVYKFYPPSNGYEYVQQCSGRGTCDQETGLCACYTGYTNDNCDTQNALAL